MYALSDLNEFSADPIGKLQSGIAWLAWAASIADFIETAHQTQFNDALSKVPLEVWRGIADRIPECYHAYLMRLVFRTEHGESVANRVVRRKAASEGSSALNALVRGAHTRQEIAKELITSRLGSVQREVLLHHLALALRLPPADWFDAENADNDSLVEYLNGLASSIADDIENDPPATDKHAYVYDYIPPLQMCVFVLGWLPIRPVEHAQPGEWLGSVQSSFVRITAAPGASKVSAGMAEVCLDILYSIM